MWWWTKPTNFIYSALSLTWSGASSKGTGTVRLPSFEFVSGNSTNVLTREVLTTWLVGDSDRSASTDSARRVDVVFDYLQAAASGSLPLPRHHIYYFEQPVRVMLQHFRLGYGVGGLVYFWFVIWLVLVVHFGRRLSKCPDHLD
jgi:hypothetical protein